MNNGNAQDLSAHKWENRIVIVKTNALDHPFYKEQLQALKGNVNGLSERKIVVYQVHNQEYKKGISNNNSWRAIEGNRRKKHLGASDSDFEIVLIGLDGGEKMKLSEFLDMDKLFGKIDAMPMRMWEMSRKN